MTHPPPPLTRDHITIASRTMLPTYPALSAVVGMAFVLMPPDRVDATPALHYATAVVSIELWGAGFLALAAWLTAALVYGSRKMACAGLAVAVAWLSIWTLVMAAAAVSELASWHAWAWPAFAARAHWASLLSLTNKET